jgi:dienelactone hydrolase
VIARDAKLPAILYACGHSGRGRDGNKTAFQDHGLWFASNGYVCLMVDTLQLGEIAGKHHGTYNLGRFWWHSRGYTPAGVECWNGIRGIDYLCSLPAVDANRIGVTGISGGGATTNWVLAADDRVKVAVPVSGVSDLECYVTDEVINGHCDCMFFHNLYQWEWTTALALFAPKPLLFANSDDDKIFPMSGNKRIIERLRKCYALFGAKEKVDEHVSKGGHDYRPDLRLAVFGFFHKHLKGDNSAIKDADFPAIEGKALRAFPEDKDIPKDAINATADETFVPVAKVELPNGGDFWEWGRNVKDTMYKRLFVERKLPLDKERVLDLGGGKRAIAMEAGVYSAMGPETKIDPDKKGPPVCVILNPDDDAETEFKRWSARYPDSRHLQTRYTRDGGPLRWTRKNPPNTVERSLVLLGQTVDSGRVWDVFQMLATRRGSLLGMVLAASGPAGIIAAYATLYESKVVTEIVIIDPPTSHRDGPHFLGVMRVVDIPEALGLLAPGIKLTLVGKSAKDKAFDRTAAIYKAAGAEDKFKRE